MMNRILAIVFLFLASQVTAQITVTPSLPTDLDAVEVIFDASQGNAGLKGYTGDVYAHTGVITNKSTSSSDWKYVKADWGVNIPDCKMTSLGNNLWRLTISPSIRQYYGVPADEQILKMAFVFRSAVQVGGTWLEGKTATGGDIFYDVYPSGLAVKIVQPEEEFLFANLLQSIPVSISATLADSVFLYVDDQKVDSAQGNSLSHTLLASEYGRKMVKALAKNASGTTEDFFYYYVRPAVPIADLPAGMKDGINYLNDNEVLLCLHAPQKEYAFAIGDFNDWLPSENTYMNRTPDGKRFWVEVGNLEKGKEYIYQYFVDGSIRVGDPYAEKVSDPWNDQYIDAETYPNMLPYPAGKTDGIATVLQTGQSEYIWQNTSFAPPKTTDLVVYELLIRDFMDKHSFNSLMDTLGYLKNLGINAIELMPVNEFEGNLSWGYNPNYYFAVDKYYGQPDDFKRFIDKCHSEGIAVLMDIALNHSFGTSPYVMLYWDGVNNRPSASSPFYNAIPKHDFNVGSDFNHESPDTKAYVSRVFKFWLEKYKIDGYRLDLSKGYTQKNTLGNLAAWAQYDQSRIDILSAYYDTMIKVNPKAIVILEHFADNSEEKVLAEKGMLLWGNLNYNYRQGAKAITGNSQSDLSWGAYTTRTWTKPNLVTYMESHDEERMMYDCEKNGTGNASYNTKDTATALKRMALSATFLFTIPGPKMIWQFGERGYDYSINYPSGTDASRLDSKPPRWDYLSQPQRKNLLGIYSNLIKLRIDNPLFETTNFDLDVASTMKRIRLKSDDLSAVVLGNFGLLSAPINPNFYQTGYWYDYFTGDSINVVNPTASLYLNPGEYRMYFSKRIVALERDERKALAFDFKLFPNPANQQVYFTITTKNPMNYKVWASRVDGSNRQLIFNQKVDQTTTQPWIPPAKGIWILKIENQNQETLTTKLIAF